MRSSRADEISDRARALLYAGVGMALLTPWGVYSDSTVLWTDFYTRWRGLRGECDGEGRPLCAATLALRDGDPEVVAWSPLVLIGDWR